MLDYGITSDSMCIILKTDFGNAMPYGAKNQITIIHVYGQEIHLEQTGIMVFLKIVKAAFGALHGNVSDSIYSIVKQVNLNPNIIFPIMYRAFHRERQSRYFTMYHATDIFSTGKVPTLDIMTIKTNVSINLESLFPIIILTQIL